MVKTFQHVKATGNARTLVRSTMFPVYYLSAEPTETAFGQERARAGASTTVTADDIIAFGRLEPITGEVHLADSRFKDKEAYTLRYLPADDSYDYTSGEVQDAEGPAHSGTILDTGAPPPIQAAPPLLVIPGRTDGVLHLQDLLYIGARLGRVPQVGDLLTPFRVVGVVTNRQSDAPEWEAVIVRDESSAEVSVA